MTWRPGISVAPRYVCFAGGIAHTDQRGLLSPASCSYVFYPTPGRLSIAPMTATTARPAARCYVAPPHAIAECAAHYVAWPCAPVYNRMLLRISTHGNPPRRALTASWRAPPAECGKWETAHKRYRLWRTEGRWQRIAHALGIMEPEVAL